MEPIKCYLLEPVPYMKRYLRRYESNFNRERCPAAENHGYHDTMVFLDEADSPIIEGQRRVDYEEWPHNDPRWPTACPCGYVFKPQDEWQLFTQSLWKRADTGEILTLRDAPVGGIYDAYWWPDKTDGQHLICIVPEHHEWVIDSRANNCDSPCKHCNTPYKDHKDKDHNYEDARPEHRCWVRHGVAPNLDVDKAGVTCNAGAGSIQTSSWHGFLRQGFLVPA